MWIFSEYKDKRYWILLIPAIIILILFDRFAPNGIPISVLTFVIVLWSIFFIWKYLGDKKKETDNEIKRPWYLREDWVYAMCFLTPPIGLINVLVHRRQWPSDDSSRYLGVAIFFNVSFVVLPRLIGMYYGVFSGIWLGVGIILVIFLTVVLWPKKDK